MVIIMRYQKTIDIWSLSKDEISKLQPGQWVEAGGSRGVFCGVKSSGSIVCMWEGNAKGHPFGYMGYRKALMDYAGGK